MQMSDEDVRAFALEILNAHLDDSDAVSRVSIGEAAEKSEHTYDGHISDEDAERVYDLLSGAHATWTLPGDDVPSVNTKDVEAWELTAGSYADTETIGFFIGTEGQAIGIAAALTTRRAADGRPSDMIEVRAEKTTMFTLDDDALKETP